MSRMLRRVGLSTLLATFAVAGPATAQEEGFTWENATEFSFVSTQGNASSNTLGLKSALTGTGGGGTFKLEVGGIRTSSDFTTRTAVGTTDDFVVTEETRTEQSAANYFARSRYDHDVGVAFAFGGAGWERNTFAGVDHRYSFVGGLGKTWVTNDQSLFKTDIGGTYTIQKDVDPDPGRSDAFGGLRATIEASHDLSSAANLSTTLVADENLQNTVDLRLDWVVSIGVALTEGLAFKTSYQVLFDNDPALIGVPLFDAGNVPAGTEVLVPSDEIDSFLTLSLVIKL